MKNIKNYEKSTQNRAQKSPFLSRLSIRLLVLVVLITTIIASFAVPVSAADPFSGARRIFINHLDSIISYTSNGQLNGSVENGFVSGTVIEGDPNTTITCSGSKLTITYPSKYDCRVTVKFDSLSIKPEEFPFVSCNAPITLTTNRVIPANTDIVQYMTDNGWLDSDGNINPNYPNGFVFNAYSSSHTWWREDITPNIIFTLREGAYTTEVEGGIQNVFDLVGTWLSTTFNTLGGVFWADGSLTVLGALSIAGLSVSVILLLLGVVTNFMRFRG